jgi:hypothetical protein
VTDSAPSRIAVRAASIAALPPPITTTSAHRHRAADVVLRRKLIASTTPFAPRRGCQRLALRRADARNTAS